LFVGEWAATQPTRFTIPYPNPCESRMNPFEDSALRRVLRIGLGPLTCQ